MGGGPQELKGPDLGKGIALAELSPNVPLLGHANGEAVLVVRLGDDVHAIGATCTHYSDPLADGIVVGNTVRCPWHHACFDLRTGEARGGPALGDVPCYRVERSGDLVQVKSKKDAVAKKPTTAPGSVLIVGAGAAAIACATTLRKEGYAGPITMLGAEEPGPVDRPNLSKDYLAGTAPDEWIPIGVPDGVELVANDPVTAIDVRAKTVSTKSGRTISYDALLYATGAEPSRLPIPGADRPHVHTLRTLADARRIIDHARQKAVIVGASFIGLEAAAALRARKIEVHIVGPETVPLARILGEDVGRFVKRIHEEKGVVFHLGTTAKSVGERSVELADGTTIDCDVVVLGVGVKPRVALAEAAGLTVDNGVVVDELLRTSAPSVWAAGDVARYPDPRLGESIRVEHWVVAQRQGESVARTMLGSTAPFRDVAFFWSNHHDVTLNYVGHASRFEEVKVHGDLEKRDAAVSYHLAGKIVAVMTINRDKTSLRVEAAMENGDPEAIEAALSS
jgi:NADPH-dependent 2,4-dienoyl-CoA reductase/sulfur reductase-like enzyme/nitrite reductase/ring-hydroxylating ferredoxin subunit